MSSVLSRRLLAPLIGVVALVVSVLCLPQQAGAMTVDPLPPDTIVHVDGDAANGFSIEYLDGSGLWPPTDSEARAECGEYDRRIARVRCRTEVRVWYDDLADMRLTITYYKRLLWRHAPEVAQRLS